MAQGLVVAFLAEVADMVALAARPAVLVVVVVAAAVAVATRERSMVMAAALADRIRNSDFKARSEEEMTTKSTMLARMMRVPAQEGRQPQ